MMENMAQSGASSGTGFLAPALSVGGSLLSAFGQQQQGASQREVGQRSLELAQFQAGQLRQNANSSLGAAQRSATDIQRNADYVASHALAVAAASGGGASDPTVINLIAQTQGEAAYRKSVALYQGDEQARAMRMQADAGIYGGQMAVDKGNQIALASNIGAAATIMRGGASLFSKYGAGGPEKNESPSNELF